MTQIGEDRDGNPINLVIKGTFGQKVSFSSGKCKKTFEIRGGKLEVRVSLGDVFNRQVNTFLERDVSKQALYIKGNFPNKVKLLIS